MAKPKPRPNPELLLQEVARLPVPKMLCFTATLMIYAAVQANETDPVQTIDAACLRPPNLPMRC